MEVLSALGRGYDSEIREMAISSGEPPPDSEWPLPQTPRDTLTRFYPACYSRLL